MTSNEIDNMCNTINSIVNNMSLEDLKDYVYCTMEQEWESGGSETVLQYIDSVTEKEQE